MGVALRGERGAGPTGKEVMGETVPLPRIM